MKFHRKKHWILLFILSCCFSSAFAADNNSLETKDSAWRFTIDPTNLEVIAENKIDKSSVQLTNAVKNLGPVTKLKIENNKIQWYYPEKSIAVNVTMHSEQADGLLFNFTTFKQQTLEWPIAGLSPQAKALILPTREGLYVPIKDAFWLNEFRKFAEISLTLPFWAIQYDQRCVSYMMPSNRNTHYAVKQNQGQLYVATTHDFFTNDSFPTYTVFIYFSNDLLTDPAHNYRQWLQDTSSFFKS